MSASKSPKIAIYTTRNCAHCRQAKAALKKWKIPFREMDIENNHRAWADFNRMRAKGVPVITVGERKLFGFEEKRLRKMLMDAGITIS